jgi:hypothetical protein
MYMNDSFLLVISSSTVVKGSIVYKKGIYRQHVYHLPQSECHRKYSGFTAVKYSW